MFFANSQKGFAFSHPPTTCATNLKHKKKQCPHNSDTVPQGEGIPEIRGPGQGSSPIISLTQLLLVWYCLLPEMGSSTQNCCTTFLKDHQFCRYFLTRATTFEVLDGIQCVHAIVVTLDAPKCLEYHITADCITLNTKQAPLETLILYQPFRDYHAWCCMILLTIPQTDVLC
jgi:hypothetical protein